MKDVKYRKNSKFRYIIYLKFYLSKVNIKREKASKEKTERLKIRNARFLKSHKRNMFEERKFSFVLNSTEELEEDSEVCTGFKAKRTLLIRVRAFQWSTRKPRVVHGYLCLLFI